MKKKIGFIGLGTMGKPMAKNLLKTGFDLTVYARRPAPAQEMVQLGAKSATSPEQVAQNSDVVITIVTADPDVEEVILGERGVLKGMREDGIIVDMSTITPKTIKKVARVAEEKGVRVLDAPVSGGEGGAKAGTLTIMVGGDEGVLEECREIFEAIGKNIFYTGELGMGQVAKIVNNLIGGITMVTISEALVLGVKAGADPKILHEIIGKSSGNSTMFQLKTADFLLKGYYKPGFMLDLMKKDIGLALSMGKDLEVPLPLGALTYQLYSGASAKGRGREDMAAVSTLMEELAGVRIADGR